MPYADPERQKAYQREWQREKQTGAAVHSPKKLLNPAPASAKELLAILTAALQEIVAIEADPIIRGRAIAYLVNVGLKGVEVSDLEERLARLEGDNIGYKDTD